MQTLALSLTLAPHVCGTNKYLHTTFTIPGSMVHSVTKRTVATFTKKEVEKKRKVLLAKLLPYAAKKVGHAFSRPQPGCH
jgi:hypothetical protein